MKKAMVLLSLCSSCQQAKGVVIPPERVVEAFGGALFMEARAVQELQDWIVEHRGHVQRLAVKLEDPRRAEMPLEWQLAAQHWDSGERVRGWLAEYLGEFGGDGYTAEDFIEFCVAQLEGELGLEPLGGVDGLARWHHARAVKLSRRLSS